MAEFRLELVDGHLIADTGGRFLLDTGSPVSFSTTGRANWGGRDRELPDQCAWTRRRRACQPRRRAARRSDRRRPPRPASLHDRSRAERLPRRRGRIGSRHDRASHQARARRPACDSRARRCCPLKRASTPARSSPTSRRRDSPDAKRSTRPMTSTPGSARSEPPSTTSLYRVDDSEFTMRFGALPDALSGMLGMLGITAILGTGLFVQLSGRDVRLPGWANPAWSWVIASVAALQLRAARSHPSNLRQEPRNSPDKEACSPLGSNDRSSSPWRWAATARA